MKRMTTIFLALPLLAGSLTAAEPDKDVKRVKAFVETNITNVLDILKNKKLDKEERKDKVLAIGDVIFDLPLMAKLSLGRKHWPKFEKAERKKFTDLFVTTLKASFLDKIDLITDEAVEFKTPKRKSKTKFEMMTVVVSKDSRYNMVYKVVKRKGKWKIYDVEIEGISIVRSYGAQYSQYLKKHSTAELLDKMSKKSFAQPKALEEKAAEIKKEQAERKKKAK
ncbi:MAG: hypothetical protein COB53_04230 [Elusimicrobia bacterium]|nr:MAG: hypothetical protein COB53_04230 [Elusimicrobiota bacterium]